MYVEVRYKEGGQDFFCDIKNSYVQNGKLLVLEHDDTSEGLVGGPVAPPVDIKIPLDLVARIEEYDRSPYSEPVG